MSKRTVLPKPIRIGAHTWTFKRMIKKPKDGDVYLPDYGDWGSCDFNSNTIFISPQIKTSFLAETIFHEVSHAMHEDLGVVDGLTEEAFTDVNAKGWMQLIINNPHLWEYIKETLNAST